MGGAVFTHRNTRMRAHNLYIQMRVSHRVTHLLKGAARAKHRKAGGKGNLSAGRQARRNANHVAFCDTAINKALWIRLFKNTGFGGRRQISVQHHNSIVSCGQLGNRFAKAFSGGLFYHFCHD